MTSKFQEANQSAAKHGLKSQHFSEVSGFKQQVQRLRKEIYHKTQTILQITAKHETTIGYLLKELKSLTSLSSDQKNELQKLEEFENAVMHWISDMRSLANTQKTNKNQSNHLQKCLPHYAQPFQQSDCQSLTLNYEAPQGQDIQRGRITTQNIIASQQLEYLHAELRKHQSQSEQFLLDGQKRKEQAITQSGRLAQNQVQLTRITQQNNGLKQRNRQLTLQLQSIKQQLGQASNDLQFLRRENKRLAEQHRQSFRSQQALNNIIAENQREIQKICTETYKLKLQIHGFQLKFKEIVENDEKQKSQELLNPKKQEQKVALCDVPTQNTIDSLQSKSSKLDAARLIKINLQFYQEKLMNFSSAASIYLS